MKTRREFLITTIGALPFIEMMENKAKKFKKKPKAIVLSTWDSGLEVNKVALQHLQNKSSALDAVEKAGIFIENTTNCCVGLGGNPDRTGKVTLDACIMDHKFQCGSVAFLQRIKNPISVAKKIMETTPHVMLVGQGAQDFATQNGFDLEPDELSENAKQNYNQWLKTSNYNPEINIENKVPAKLPDGKENHDTMGTICIDNSGHLAGMCTTSGMAYKLHGRVGDSPIIGSGLYVDGQTGAATCSGQGEEVIRICGTHTIVEYMRNGMSPASACKKTIERIVNIDPVKAKKFQVGFIAINKKGEYGAYSIQPNFSYAVTFEDGRSEVQIAKSFFI
ncbi:MAG: N(4)-(beta-N-acetylglucosaminyl)-L-asparaginase [Saprospiraceae bacterium]|nr:N(4)-(beta-N-acetylglucosaminyl)-L-asparaginase [Saprospiraceae bacterium]MBK7524900.1 N(4)-(beta-N-acetylglucosaminyl)-L-asparaginase [Saprospiraceae bacterium]MBK8081214.1 N(4)-(beta-N-acetylglucosaminyl)-L-asparaginase [Saprospiraceae bacterium]MBK8370165.1 N(4)-(beta-N-acetylglucosaminyl)-L-asparaginase [Saprospiraceae bacterium]MBK8546821.1 N(4)-(beta-N-acetylglucosaminyl)-L-asparaginase [Saprospiraceae bacterium]